MCVLLICYVTAVRFFEPLVLNNLQMNHPDSCHCHSSLATMNTWATIKKNRPYFPLKPGCSIGIPTMGYTLIYIIYMYIKNPITKGSITPRVFLHCSLNWCSAVFLLCFRAVSTSASHGDAVYLALSNASLRPHHPGEVGVPTFPTSSRFNRWIWWGGVWWVPPIYWDLSTGGFQEFYVCDLEKI